MSKITEKRRRERKERKSTSGFSSQKKVEARVHLSYYIDNERESIQKQRRKKWKNKGNEREGKRHRFQMNRKDLEPKIEKYF